MIAVRRSTTLADARASHRASVVRVRVGEGDAGDQVVDAIGDAVDSTAKAIQTVEVVIVAVVAGVVALGYAVYAAYSAKGA